MEVFVSEECTSAWVSPMSPLAVFFPLPAEKLSIGDTYTTVETRSPTCMTKLVVGGSIPSPNPYLLLRTPPFCLAGGVRTAVRVGASVGPGAGGEGRADRRVPLWCFGNRHPSLHAPGTHIGEWAFTSPRERHVFSERWLQRELCRCLGLEIIRCESIHRAMRLYHSSYYCT